MSPTYENEFFLIQVDNFRIREMLVSARELKSYFLFLDRTSEEGETDLASCLMDKFQIKTSIAMAVLESWQEVKNKRSQIARKS